MNNKTSNTESKVDQVQVKYDPMRNVSQRGPTSGWYKLGSAAQARASQRAKNFF